MESVKHSFNIDSHSRVVIHFDLDCFYAQVEMIKKPELCKLPLGIQQKNIVVTSNYIARQFGIQKCMLVTEALKLCPSLELVKGEDLYDYRQMSYKVTTLLQTYSSLVERLGLDENFVDVTHMVNERLKSYSDVHLIGNVFSSSSEICDCGCYERLTVGSIIAQEIRDCLKSELKLTSCAGIGHNKLIAKLVCSLHKPNQQTTIFPNAAFELMTNLENVQQIPGIGTSIAEMLNKLGITTVQDLQNCDTTKLKAVFGTEKAKWLYCVAHGNDNSIVKPSGKPQSIGLEDSCKSLSAVEEIREKLLQLLNRLIILINEDGRLPRTIKLTVRKFDKRNNVSHRECRQCNVTPNLFILSKADKNKPLSEASERKLMSLIMKLFVKLVDISRPYHITLLGLSFTKFQERFMGKASISSYFEKDIAVQSLTSIENKISPEDLLGDFPSISSQNIDVNLGDHDLEAEPSLKKSKINVITAKRRCLIEDDSASPSKLKVAELRLNSREFDQPFAVSDEVKEENGCDVQCPPNASEEIFWELPKDVQQELWEDWKRQRNLESSYCNRQAKKPKSNSLLNYFVKN